MSTNKKIFKGGTVFTFCIGMAMCVSAQKSYATLDSGFQSCLATVKAQCDQFNAPGSQWAPVFFQDVSPPEDSNGLIYQQTSCKAQNGTNLGRALCQGTSDTGEAPIPKQGNDAQACVGGSIIHVDSQSVGESVAIVGTPFALVYFSDRVKGRVSNYQIDIPIVGPSPVSDLLSVTLNIIYAGTRTYTQTFSATANTTYHFIWDGLDASGNPTPSTNVSGSLSISGSAWFMGRFSCWTRHMDT